MKLLSGDKTMTNQNVIDAKESTKSALEFFISIYMINTCCLKGEEQVKALDILEYLNKALYNLNRADKLIS